MYLVVEEDPAVCHLHDTAVGDRHPEDVGREIFDARLTLAYGLGIDVPRFLPYLLGNATCQPRLFHPFHEFGAEDSGERLHRHKEMFSALPPPPVGGRDCAAGNNIM